jgi:hypothetical protein
LGLHVRTRAAAMAARVFVWAGGAGGRDYAYRWIYALRPPVPAVRPGPASSRRPRPAPPRKFLKGAYSGTSCKIFRVDGQVVRPSVAWGRNAHVLSSAAAAGPCASRARVFLRKQQLRKHALDATAPKVFDDAPSPQLVKNFRASRRGLPVAGRGGRRATNLFIFAR